VLRELQVSQDQPELDLLEIPVQLDLQVLRVPLVQREQPDQPVWV
jgi:hypothetical protein